VKNRSAIYCRRVDSSLSSPAVSAVSRDGLPGGQAVLNGVQSNDRALMQMGADAILVAIVIAGTHHRQGAVVSRPRAVQQLAHTLAKVARQEGVQQRIQAGVQIREEEGRHGQQSAEVRRAIVVRAPVSP